MKNSEDPFACRWSSLSVYVGRLTSPKWLTATEMLSHFASKNKRGYKEFITDGMKSGFKTAWDEVKGQAVIGSEDFVEEVVGSHNTRSWREARGTKHATGVCRSKAGYGIETGDGSI